MKKLCLTLVLCLIAFSVNAQVSNPPIEVTEEDASPSTFPYKLKFPNTSVTDNGDGTASISFSSSGTVSGSIVVASFTLTPPVSFGGRSITANGNAVDADTELYTDTKCLYFENPVATDDFQSIWYSVQPATITKIWAESDQTVTFMLQVDDGSPSDVDTVDLAPAAGTATDTSLDGDTSLATGDRLDLAVTSVSGTPTWCSICWEFTYND